MITIFVRNFDITLPIKIPNAIGNNSFRIEEFLVEAKEGLETVNYSPYKNIGLCAPLLLTNFMFELYRVYLQVLDSRKKSSSYKIHWSQIQEFLEMIGYNDLDYTIITRAPASNL